MIKKYFLLSITIFFCHALHGMKCITVHNKLPNTIMLTYSSPDAGFLGAHVLIEQTMTLKSNQSERIMISPNQPPTMYTLIENNAQRQQKVVKMQLPKEDNGVIIIE